MNAEDRIYETPHRALLTGILDQAGEDLRRFRTATTTAERELYRDARCWLRSEDHTSPFSFLNVCRSLGRAPEEVRQELLDDMSLGPFGYWTRRSIRVARKLQIFLNRVFTHERNSNTVEPGAFAHAMQ
jgi:hypothetical protein